MEYYKVVNGVRMKMTPEEVAELKKQQAEYEKEQKNRPPSLEEQVSILTDYILKKGI